MKKILLLLLFMVGIVSCGSSDDSTPFIPSVVPTFPVRVDIASYALPPESKNWKYGISDNSTDYAKANYIAECLGKIGTGETPDAYVRYHYGTYINEFYIQIYSAKKDKLLYYMNFERGGTNSPATLYNSMMAFAIDSIKNYPLDSFSGVVELPY